MRYVDTSVLVAALTAEPRTDAMQTWLASQDPHHLHISDWVRTEFASALAIKVRTGQLQAEHRREVQRVFDILVARSLESLPVARDDFQVAARFVAESTVGLRGGDGLHLAVAASHGLTVCTLDGGLAAAGEELSVATELL